MLPDMMGTMKLLLRSSRQLTLAALLLSSLPAPAQTTPPLGQPFGFWSAAHPEWPPLPAPPPGVTAQLLGVTTDGVWVFVLQDLGFPYAAALSPSRATSGAYDDWQGGGGPQPSYNPATDFILDIAVTNNLAWLTAYNIRSNYFQIQSLTNVPRLAGQEWAIEEQYVGLITNVVTLDPIPVDGVPAKFFRGAESDTLVSIVTYTDSPAVEPWPTSPATFYITRTNANNDYSQPLTVYYTTSGSAIPGQTYSNLSGSVTIQQDRNNALVEIVPLADDLVRSNTTVVLSLVMTNTYLVDSNAPSALNYIIDNPFHAVATNIYLPTTLACQALSNALLVAYDWPDGLPYTFAQILTNTATSTNSDNSLVTCAALTNWPGVSNLSQLDVLAVVTAQAGQATNAAGFTNGDLFFNADAPGVISWISADGSSYVSNWVTLPGETNYVRGALAFDQNGVYGGDLLVVTGDSDNYDYELSQRNIYRVHSDKTAVLIASIDAYCLEGVCAVPNDTNRYGPLAGKIITADQNVIPPLVWAADSQSTTNFLSGWAVTDFHIIPTNQDFYLPGSYGIEPITGKVDTLFKVSRLYLQDYVGDLLMTQEDGALFILHWDPVEGFVIYTIAYPTSYVYIWPDFEPGAFAPFPIPLISPQPYP
jgi:hypothetical protein